jgi:hypothetical protein
MKSRRMLAIPIITGVLTFASNRAISAQDKYTVKVPNGLSFSEFRDTRPGKWFPSVRTET